MNQTFAKIEKKSLVSLDKNLLRPHGKQKGD
jgi:hypothetical protein